METLLSQCEIIDRKLAVDGELGSLIASIASEDLNPHQKLRKTERYIEALDREVEVLIATVVPAFNSLYEVLNGILYGEVGGVYVITSYSIHYTKLYEKRESPVS